MTVGLIEAVTSALGEELARLSGYRSTKLTAAFSGAARVSSGINSVGSSDSGVTVDLVSGSFGAEVVAGRRFRILSGVLAGESALIDAVGGSSLTLAGSGLGENFSAASWEVLTEPDTTAEVESTFEWLSAGRVIVEGIEYRFSGKTSTTLTGMAWFDLDADVWVSGAKQTHAILSEVVDYSGVFSALDNVRRSLSTETAEGSDLDIIGRDRGVPRPSQLADDDVYRDLIRAIAKSPRGTEFCLEAALDVLFSAGNWVLHEDTVNHPCTVFFHRSGLEDSIEGKAFLDGHELLFPDSTTAIEASEEPRAVVSVQYADEGGERLIDEDSEDATSADGIVVAGTFGGQILAEDWFEVTSGPLAGSRAQVVSKDSGIQITLQGDGIGSAFSSPQSWRIFRWATHCGLAKPSAETVVEYPGDAGTSTWTFVGDDEATDVTLSSTTYGPHMVMADPGVSEIASYEHAMRIEPESAWSFSAQVAIPSAATVDQGASSGLQFALVVHDGAQAFGAGFIEDGGGSVVGVGLVHATGGSAGAWAGAGPSATVAKDSFRHVEICRDAGSGAVRLLLDGSEVESVDASVFGASSARKVVFGCLSTSLSGMQALVKRVEYRAETDRDFWNSRVSDGVTSASNTLTSASAPFVVLQDVGKVLLIKDFGASNAGGGNARGRWQILAAASTGQVTLRGVTDIGADFDDLHEDRVTVRDDPFAFRWPDSLGHTLVIEDGLNAGSETITALIDPVTGEEMGHEGWSNIAVCAGAEFVDAENSSWRVDPVFPSDSGLQVEFPSGSFSGVNLTLRQSLTINPASAEPVLRVSYTRWLSAFLEDDKASTARLGDGGLDRYPFFLYGPFGDYEEIFMNLVSFRDVPVFDGLIVDEAGIHVID